MALNSKERKIVDEKFENPNKSIKCPKCGKPLIYSSFDSAEQVKCPTAGCVKVTLRGI